jgi:hypothetical protein
MKARWLFSSKSNMHRNNGRRLLLALAAVALVPGFLGAQGPGAIDLSARITPTGAHPEPVRQFDFYVLTRSYADVVKEVESQDVLPTQDKYIEDLKCSPELKAWIKEHKQLDLASPDIDGVIKVDDIMKVPEFFDAYQRSNSGGVTKGLPQPKYKEADKTANPEKYKKQREEYLAATRKFIEANPFTISGIELELASINPKTAWDTMHVEHKRRVEQLAPDTAQVKYLAGKVETDLNGHAVVTGLRPGTYWVSTLGMDAASGDRRLLWDVPVTVQAGAATHVDLTNLNGTDMMHPTSRKTDKTE